MIIGQPKTIAEFAPLNQGEMEHVVNPLIQALQSGCPLDTAVSVDFGVLCRLTATVGTLIAQNAALRAQVAALAPPPPVLRAPSPDPAEDRDYAVTTWRAGSGEWFARSGESEAHAATLPEAVSELFNVMGHEMEAP